MLPEELPARVRENVSFLDRSGIWYLPSSNPEVRSCRDAAAFRWRLGDRGIPLCDELKSSVGAIQTPTTSYVAIHCRGHQYIDDAKAEAHLGGQYQRLSEQELRDVFGMEYGVVTPFGLARHPDVLQIFDETVLEPYFPPFTMMTNLGSLTSGVELDMRDLLGALPNAETASVVRDVDTTTPRQHTIGILTGNAPESGMLLWEYMNDHIRERGNRHFRGDVSFPRVLVESVPCMGLSMELPLREREVRRVVLEGIKRLCEAGATIVGIACNTTQYFAEEVKGICAAHDARFVSLVDETVRFLQHQQIESFDFFGISAVTDFGRWSAFDALNEQFTLSRPSEREVESVNDVAFSVKQRGVDGRAVNRLRDLVNSASQTDTVVIALTELSAVLAQHPKRKGDKRIVDTLEILATAIAELYLGERRVIDVPRPTVDDELLLSEP